KTPFGGRLISGRITLDRCCEGTFLCPVTSSGTPGQRRGGGSRQEREYLEDRALRRKPETALIGGRKGVHSMPASRWAVILCKFADGTSPTPPLLHYQRLFTGAGSGSFNIVEFFSDMSHGHLDLSGSQVFGWFTLGVNRSDYGFNASPLPPGKLSRGD